MKKKNILFLLISVFLLSTMVVTPVVALRTVGVEVGDWFKYEDITLNWSSNDPNATFPPSGWEWLAKMNETDWISLSIVDVSATNITSQMTTHFKNGTEETSGGYIDVDTGDGENATLMIISANLIFNETVYTSPAWSDWRINETRVTTYPESTRLTNHLNITYGPLSWNESGTEYYYYFAKNYSWDRSSGILVEESFEEFNQTGELLTTWSFSLRITDSEVWVIPEFPTWTSLLLIILVLTVALSFYKRVHNGKKMCSRCARSHVKAFVLIS